MKISPSYKQLFFVSICILCIFIETYQAIKNTNFTQKHKTYKSNKQTYRFFILKNYYSLDKLNIQ